MFNFNIQERVARWALDKMNGEGYSVSPSYKLGRLAASEVAVIHGLFEQLGVKAAIDISNVVASDTGNFIRYPIVATGKISGLDSVVQDLETALSMHRQQELTVRIRKPLLSIELPYPLEVRPLMWTDARFDDLKPGQMLLGMDYTSSRPEPAIVDFNRTTVAHGMIGGATGSGKTTLIACMIASFCKVTSPADAQIIFLDPKYDESFADLAGFPHVTVVNGAIECASYVASVRAELERRKPNPDKRRIIMIIDEYAELKLMLGKEVGQQMDEDIASMAGIGRSKNVHIFLATQKPTVEIVDTVAKGNFTTRLGGLVMTPKESEIIMGRGGVGCEGLPGKGTFYVVIGGGQTRRIQSYLLEGQTLRDAIDVVQTTWAGVEPYRINLITPDVIASLGATIDNDADDIAKILEFFTVDQLFDDTGKTRNGMQIKVIRVLFGDDAKNVSPYRDTVLRLLNRVRSEYWQTV
jgi:hypothetical protein